MKVHTYTQPRENILTYSPWALRLDKGWRVVPLSAGRRHGKTIVAKLEGFETRDQTRGLLGAEIAIEPNQLAGLPEGEFYWAQLIGLRAVNLNGYELGRVAGLMETKASDVLVVKGVREFLVPFVRGEVVKTIDLDAGYIKVDWNAYY